MNTRIPRRRNLWRGGSTGLAVLLVVLGSGPLWAQSFSLDDNPFAPAVGPPGALPGFGEENPFGILPVVGYPPGLAPSPTLPLLPPSTGDGAILSPSPAPGFAPAALQHPGPDGFYVASLSSNKTMLTPVANPTLEIMFSVDRLSMGAPLTAVAGQAALAQAPGDVYTTIASFAHPGTFAGTLASAGVLAIPSYAGILPFGPVGPPGNLLTYNQGLPGPPASGVAGLGLMTGGPAPFPVIGPATVLGPGAIAPPITPATHDNLDGFDLATFDGAPADGFFDINCYFSVYPDSVPVVPPGLSSAAIFLAPAGAAVAPPVPWAPSGALGMDTLGPHPFAGTPFSDSVDALVVWDNGIVGTMEPMIDYALFSLAPGSLSLGAVGPGIFDDSTVLFTDFTGLFAVYAMTPALGLLPDFATNGLAPRPIGVFVADGVDALEVVPAIWGDLDDDDDVDADDIDRLWHIIRLIEADDPNANDMEDLNGDSFANEDDVDFMLASLLTAGTSRAYGDANLSGGTPELTDYNLWRTGTGGWANGDFDGSGGVPELTDYNLWRTGPTEFPGSVGPHGGGAPLVPEPTTLSLFAMGIVCLTAFRYKRQRLHK